MNKLIFNYLNHILIAALLIGGYVDTIGQERKHEFSISAGGVFSSINYKLEDGNVKHDRGAGLGLRYMYYVSESWSIGFGAEYQSYNSTAKIDAVENSYTTTDVENESFEFRYSGSSYIEKQNAEYINIPLILQYETSDDDVRFYIAGGIKAGIPINADYKTSINTLSTSGYYPQYNVELFDPAFMGFGQFNGVENGKQELDTKLAWSGTVETGIKQAVGDHGWAYVGVYLDYGFTKIYDNGNKNLVTYPQEMPVNLQYKSILDTSLAGDARLVSYGFKFRLAIN